MNTEQLAHFFGQMTLINAVILLFSTVMLMAMKDFVARLHGKMFGLSKEQIGTVVYAYLGVYKLLIIVFNLVPFLVLHFM